MYTSRKDDARTQQGGSCLQPRNRAPYQELNGQLLYLRHPRLQSCDKSLLFKSLSPWYFLMADGAKTDLLGTKKWGTAITNTQICGNSFGTE